MNKEKILKDTTLCYIEKNGAYLMMHRVKKQNDMNKDKYVGIGGKLEENETPFDCAVREIKEETGLTAFNLLYRGIVTFVSNEYGTEKMHLFTASDFNGTLNKNCNEGELVWIKKQDVYNLPIWEGDKIFFELLEKENKFFHLTLVYEGEKLVSHTLKI